MNNSTNTTTALSLAELLFEEASQSLPSSLSQGNYLEFITVIKSLTDIMTVSNNVILIWDIIITYDQEIELIWWLVCPPVIEDYARNSLIRSRHCIVNYLFFFIRYGALSQGM